MYKFFAKLLDADIIDLVILGVLGYSFLKGFWSGFMSEVINFLVTYLLVPFIYMCLYRYNKGSSNSTFKTYFFLIYIAISFFSTYLSRILVWVLKTILGKRAWKFLNDGKLGAVVALCNMACYISLWGYLLQNNANKTLEEEDADTKTIPARVMDYVDSHNKWVYKNHIKKIFPWFLGYMKKITGLDYVGLFNNPT